MKPKYIADFENLGLGLFIHFGLYSVEGKGEWFYWIRRQEAEPIYGDLPKRFKVKKNWAKELVKFAKSIGAKYITLTTRHHDGFSLYDTCGLNEYDAPHSATGRDLIREFVDECNAKGIVPFFYHTLLDWHEHSYDTDFDTYLEYLKKSVEVLCTRYGKIGGLWFDGMWDARYPNRDWKIGELYSLIRKYQPEAMIINNTGLSATGEIGHPEIDSVTFERGKPRRVVNSAKEIAGEMCDGIDDHWGYTKLDICTKPTKVLLSEFIDCRRYNCNFLINSGLRGDGSVKPIDRYTLQGLGLWIKENKNFIYKARGVDDIEIDDACLMKDDKWYYAIIKDVPMNADPAVAVNGGNYRRFVTIHTDKKITNASYLDNGKKAVLSEKHTFSITPFLYGNSLYARVIRFKLK